MLWYGSETPELVRFRNTRTLAGHAKQNAWTFLVASTLAARLGPKPVYRNAKCRGGAESSAQAKPSADVPWCREGAHAKRPNSSRIRAHAKQNAVEEPMRNARTAAGFMPSKMPWRSPCETPEQQQDSSPCQAKCSPTKSFMSSLEPIKTVLLAGSLFTRILQAAKSNNFPGALPLTARGRRKRAKVPNRCFWNALKTRDDRTEQQLEKVPKRCLKKCRNVAFGMHSRLEPQNATRRGL